MNMSIGMLCHSGFGGSARVAVELAHALVARGHEVHLLARSRPPGARSGGGLTVHALGERPPSPVLDIDWTQDEIARFDELTRQVVLRHRIDLLHFHYALPFVWVTQRVNEVLGAAAPPVVGTLHGTDVSIVGWGPRRQAVAAALARTSLLTTVSRDHARLTAASYDVVPRVIPNFIDLDEFRPGPPRRGRPRIAYVSNFREVKQPEAMARIARAALDRADGELWLIGDGAGMPAVEAILSDHIAAGRVRHWGLRTDVATLLPQTDAVLVTSAAESFSLVSLEAMACGVPVVAPRVGGIPELVRHGSTGYLFDSGDEAAATDHLVDVLTSPRLRAGFGRAGRAAAAAYAADAVVPAYEGAYREALANVVPRVPQEVSRARPA